MAETDFSKDGVDSMEIEHVGEVSNLVSEAKQKNSMKLAYW